MEQQGSENDAQGPLPCANDCGFFGSPATRNLCSKCFRDSLRHAEAAHQAVATASASAVTAPSSSSAAVPVDHEAVTAAGTEEAEEGKGRAKGRSGRCAACGRKVGLMGFECRCGGVFCGAHRYSDRHDCGFDYRGAGRDAIARANPVVRAEKQVDKL